MHERWHVTRGDSLRVAARLFPPAVLAGTWRSSLEQHEASRALIGMRWSSGSNCRRGERGVLSTSLECDRSCPCSRARPPRHSLHSDFSLPVATPPCLPAPGASWPWRAASRRPSCASAGSGPTFCSSTTRRISQSSAGPGQTTIWKTTKTVINKKDDTLDRKKDKCFDGINQTTLHGFFFSSPHL